MYSPAARLAAARAALAATVAALDASTARIQTTNAAAAQPPRAPRPLSPLVLLVWAAQRPAQP